MVELAPMVLDEGEIAALFELDSRLSESDEPESVEPWLFDPDDVDCADEVYELACITRLERHVARAQGEQIVAIASFLDKYLATYDTAENRQFDQDAPTRSAYAEIALALGISAQTSDARVTTASRLVERLPATVAAMCAGRVTLSRARVLLEETENLDADKRRRVEDELLPKAPALTPGNLRRSVRRLVEKIDAEALVKRKGAAKADRFLRWYDLPDGMATLEARLSAADAAAVFGVVDALAHAAAAPGDPRSIDQIRADAFVDAMLRPAEASDRVRHTINLLVPANVLLGAPGVDTVERAAAALTGADADSELVRAIAADATWQRILTDPLSGDVLDANPRRYRPSADLVRYIRARDQHCRWPGCRRPALRSDLDHTVAAESGGPTIRRNLAAMCRKHHRAKHLPGWHCEQTEGGVLAFTTPMGRTYRTRPPTADGEDHPIF